MSKVLVINCGSSSVKYQLFNMADRSRLLCKGMVERISQPNSYLLHSKGKLRFKKSLFIKNHSQAISIIVEVLEDKKFGLIKDYSDIYGIGHRVVHGGEEFRKPIFLNDSVVKRLSKYDELAPLHNPPNITGIKVCRKLFPGIRQVAIFDTAFYGSVPEYAYMYAIPYRYYKKHL